MLFDQLFEDSTPYPETKQYAQQVARSMHERGYRDGESSDREFISVVADTLQHLTRDADTRVWMMNHDKEFLPLIKKYLQHLAGESVAEGVNVKQIKRDLDSGMSYDAVIGKHANKRLTNTDEIRRVIQQHAWEKRMKKPKEQGVQEGSADGSKLARIATKAARQSLNDVDKEILLRAAKLFAAGKKNTALRVIDRMDDYARDDFYMTLALSGVKLPVEEAIPAHIKKSDVPPAMRSRLTMKDIEAERPKGAYRYRVGDKEFMDLAAAQSFARGTGETVKPIQEVKKKLGEREPNGDRTPRIQRILSMLRARYPHARDDLEALLLSYRADQSHDQQEIDRLDAENDQEEADIDSLERTVTDIIKKRNLAENKILWNTSEQMARSKFNCISHPAYQEFAEKWYLAHGGTWQ